MKCPRQLSITTLASASEQNMWPLSNSFRSLALKLSIWPFSQGLCGAMYAVFAPSAAINSCAAWMINYSPLFDLTCLDAPRLGNRSGSASRT